MTGRATSGLVARLHSRAVKQLRLLRGRLTLESFTAAIDRSVAHRFRDSSPAPHAIATYIESLNAADLGLAVLCDEGDEAAWEHLVLSYRPLLYRAASILAGADETGRELADSLWAELYGVGHTRSSLAPGEERRSLFRYFHGRSKLSTWFRSVLAQRHVDLVRARTRTETLDTSDPPVDAAREPSVVRPATVVEPVDPDRARFTRLFRQTLDTTLAGLTARDRLRLSCYYLQALTLAETGRLLKEHEATVSRHLARVRRELRQEIEAVLRDQHQLTQREIDLCYQYVVEDRSVDLSTVLKDE